MNFKTHNDEELPFVGGSLIGYIDISYKELKDKLGKPMDGDGYKVDAEWEIQFEDGVQVRIYNYKDGKNYNGKHGTPKTQITDWHIGGGNEKEVDRVAKLFPNAPTRKGW